jgi:catechol 2,3-dioxygenase-like lactoylglutathione lyase family enzyme
VAVQLNHTIVSVRDKHEAARFFAEILGLPEPGSYGPFRVLELANGVSLDFADDHGPVLPRHYAFPVDDAKSDEIFGRIKQGGLDYLAGRALVMRSRR